MSRIIIDIDGVACAHAKAICNKVNKEFGLSATSDDVLSWDHDFGPVTFVEAVKEYYPLEGFILDMEPTPGFKECLEEIDSMALVSFATARKHNQFETEAWIEKHFGNSFGVEFVLNKSELESCAVIDDSEHEIEAVAAKGVLGILFNQPWNDHEAVDELLSKYSVGRRARNFHEVVTFLKDGLSC